MRSLNLRRAAMAAALVFVDCYCLFFAPHGQVAGSWLVTRILRTWIDSGLLVGLPMTVLACIAFGARMVMRQHVRAGGGDPLEGVRRWVAGKRWLFRVFYAAAALGAMSLFVPQYRLPDSPVQTGAVLLTRVVLPALAMVLVLRAFGRVAVSPVVHPAELERKDAEGYLFSAVAVTAESRAGVVLLGLSTVDGVDVAPGGDILLVRRGKAVLRLQLHGEDAARRGPIVERSA